MTAPRDNAVVGVAVGALLLVVLAFAAAAFVLRPNAAGGHDGDIPLLLAAEAVPVEAATSAAPAVPSTAGGRLGVSEDWVQRTASRTNLPVPAVRAYGAAALRLAATHPACHLGWTTLAGIGTVESGNGTGGHRTLSDAGYSSTPIVGPALNGAGYAAIQTGSGDWDHAWGPMQFITSTWNRWADDGDGDGTADINNIYDAAVTAGDYLCADARNLATPQGWTDAVLSYNHSAAYVQQVYAAANAAAR